MMTLVAVVHIIVAILLVSLVLIQDSKGGGALGIGDSGGSKSLLGATGAQTLAARMTRWAGVLFAITCVTLTLMTANRTKSVLDTALPAPTQALPVVPPAAPVAPATPEANAKPAADAAPVEKK